MINEPIVIAFDEVDRVLGRAYQTDFTSLLRVWHERRTARPPTAWARTGLAIVTSTEPYLFIKDIKEGKAPSRDAFFRLHGAGLVREDGKRMIPLNKLYARFFGKL